MDNTKANNMLLLSGDEALGRGAYEEGLAFVASYPGTPATEILEYLSTYTEIDTQWSVNEKVAYEVAYAASIAGCRSLYASKHVGLNVAMDPLMTSAYMGVNGGFIVVSCDDPGLHSSQNEQDNRLIAHMAKIPLLEPSSPAEAKAFIPFAFETSERFDTPVMVRMTTRIAHTKENVLIGDRKNIAPRPFAINMPKYVMVPGNAYRRHIALEARLVELGKYASASPLNRIEMNDTNLGFITSGVSYLYAKEMYPGASFLKLGMSFPFPAELVKRFAKGVKEIMVLEELEPFLEDEVRKLGIPFRTKDRSFRVGELRPELIPSVVNGDAKKDIPSTTRKPVMCPGCPHRLVFTVLKKAKAIVAGDIGCYTLGALPPLSSLHTCLCMGAGVTFFEGMGKVLGKDVVGVIGDSTFVHSGVTGLINAAYNRAKGLLIILDNSTTAMTGAQPNPATGVTIKGDETRRLILEDLCKVCGAANVDVIDPHRVKEFEALVKKRMGEDALSVIIARSPCKIIKREKRIAPVYDKAACKKCYLCLNSGCPAIVKQDDGYIEINESICVGCKLCKEVCVFGALKDNE